MSGMHLSGMHAWTHAPGCAVYSCPRSRLEAKLKSNPLCTGVTGFQWQPRYSRESQLRCARCSSQRHTSASSPSPRSRQRCAARVQVVLHLGHVCKALPAPVAGQGAPDVLCCTPKVLGAQTTPRLQPRDDPPLRVQEEGGGEGVVVLLGLQARAVKVLGVRRWERAGLAWRSRGNTPGSNPSSGAPRVPP